jgi:hypothetical protein
VAAEGRSAPTQLERCSLTSSEFQALSERSRGLVDDSADGTYFIRRVVYWSNRLCVSSKGAIDTMEAHGHRGFAFGFRY